MEAMMVAPGTILNVVNFGDDRIKCASHGLVHWFRLTPFDEIRPPPVTRKETGELSIAHARQQRGVRDLVAIQVKNRKNGAIPSRIDELINLPTGGQRPGFCFAIPDYAAGQQIRVIENRSASVYQRIAQFSTFVNGAGSLGGGVAGNASGKGELLEQFSHSLLILGDIGIKLAIGALQVRIGHHSRPAVTRTSDVDDVEVVLFDQPVEMHVDEVQARRCAPMPEQAWLDVLQFEGLA